MAKSKKQVCIWYKPNCQTCIKAKAILEKNKIQPEYFLYLEEEITEAMLVELLEKLHLKPEVLVRKKEPIYKEKFEGKKMTNKQWIKALVKHPILIERPIVIEGDQAFIGRPLERLEAFCKK